MNLFNIINSSVHEFFPSNIIFFIFVMYPIDEELPSIEVIKNDESRSIIWHKTRAAWQYLYDHHRDGFDWYLKIDDDSCVPQTLLTWCNGQKKKWSVHCSCRYVIMENLRSFLASKNKEDPIAFGHKYKLPSGAYFAGGSGESLMLRFGYTHGIIKSFFFFNKVQVGLQCCTLLNQEEKLPRAFQEK